VHFDLVDAVLEQTADRIVTVKQVTAAEEYLQDHFATFPVLPGVLMLEAMVQAGRRLVGARMAADAPPLVLGTVRALKYGRFVKPGSSLRVEVSLLKALEGGAFDLKGEAVVVSHADAPGTEPPTAVSGRFTLRPVRLATASTQPAALVPLGEPVTVR
jgi:3-hydroxyacyl-[acyl-carrier-protein] dehydratase